MVPAGVLWYFALSPPHGSGLDFHEGLLLWTSFCAVTGLFTLVLALLSRPQSALLLAAATVLVCVTVVNQGLTKNHGQGLSIRSSVQAAKNHWSDFSASQASSFRLPRADQYGLNFYLRREVPTWSRDQREPGWVFGTKKLVGDDWTEGMNCIVTDVDTRSQRVVCMDPGSWQRLLNSVPDSGQPH
jgi:hypothetical protein